MQSPTMQHLSLQKPCSPQTCSKTDPRSSPPQPKLARHKSRRGLSHWPNCQIRRCRSRIHEHQCSIFTCDMGSGSLWKASRVFSLLCPWLAHGSKLHELPCLQPIVYVAYHIFALSFFCSGTCVNSLSLCIADFRLSMTSISMSR